MKLSRFIKVSDPFCRSVLFSWQEKRRKKDLRVKNCEMWSVYSNVPVWVLLKRKVLPTLLTYLVPELCEVASLYIVLLIFDVQRVMPIWWKLQLSSVIFNYSLIQLPKFLQYLYLAAKHVTKVGNTDNRSCSQMRNSVRGLRGTIMVPRGTMC